MRCVPLGMVVVAVVIGMSKIHLGFTSPTTRQDEGEEEATTPATNGHLIGTLAGVLSSILRSGPNGTSPIKFNLTAALQRLTRFQLFPLWPATPKEDDQWTGQEGVPLTMSTGHLNLTQKQGKKKVNYRIPGHNPNYANTVLHEDELPKQTAEEDEDEGPTTPNPPTITNVSPPPTPESASPDPPLSLPLFPASPEDEGDYLTPTHIPARQEATSTVSAKVPNQTTAQYPEDWIDLKNVDVPGIAFWSKLHLIPVINLAKEATRNISVTDVVNGTAQGFKAVVNGTAEGFKAVVTALPTFAEAFSQLAEFFEDIV